MTLDGRIGESLYSSRRAMAYKITNAMRRFYIYFPCKSFQASRIGMNAFLGTLSFEPDNLKAWHLMMSDFRCVSALRCVEWRKIRVENLKKKVRKQTFALNAFGKVNRSTEADLLFILGNGLETVLVSTRPVEVCNAREAASPRDHYSGSGSRITAKYCPCTSQEPEGLQMIKKAKMEFKIQQRWVAALTS
ncbi:hypothetical protein T4B_13209 [Trichinella pseudospiralis]|uniref:Uncharacterized protein n=1 Tax=Trichinella pseudospiralis TaxID=6337 RepID=A0A0V1JDB4_TRIPS|nr:hypothetical protein T4B_13209 [Trichinella pseudospiralis]